MEEDKTSEEQNVVFLFHWKITKVSVWKAESRESFQCWQCDSTDKNQSYKQTFVIVS